LIKLKKTTKFRGGIIRNEKMYSLIIKRKDVGAKIRHLKEMRPKCK
jgi:hypothetical protein